MIQFFLSHNWHHWYQSKGVHQPHEHFECFHCAGHRGVQSSTDTPLSNLHNISALHSFELGWYCVTDTLHCPSDHVTSKLTIEHSSYYSHRDASPSLYFLCCGMGALLYWRKCLRHSQFVSYFFPMMIKFDATKNSKLHQNFFQEILFSYQNLLHN